MFYNTGLEVLFSGVFAALVAQFMKVIFYFVSHRKFNFKIFSTTGGMPSSHSAGVVAITTGAGLVAGFLSVEFAVAAGLSLVVLQDAAGLRRAAGRTAATLNRLVEEFQEHTNETKPNVALKELLGHTPFEVFCGIMLGVVIAGYVHYVLPGIIPLKFD